jgi:hypothetical protein
MLEQYKTPGYRLRSFRLAVPCEERQEQISQQLKAHKGIAAVTWTGTSTLRIGYLLPHIDWQTIESLIVGMGGQPVKSMWERLRRRWLRNSDAVGRDYLGDSDDLDEIIMQIYVSRYRQRLHGRRDDRRHNWRKYLPIRRGSG